MYFIVAGIVAILFLGFPLLSFIKNLRRRNAQASHPGLMDDYIKMLAELEVKKQKKQDEEEAAAARAGKAKAMTNRHTNSKSRISKVPAVNPSTGKAKTITKKKTATPAAKGTGGIKVKPSTGPHKLKKPTGKAKPITKKPPTTH